MAEAFLTLSQALDRAKSGQVLDTATITLARQRAINATKTELKGRGLKPSHIPHRDIVVAAEQYLAQHRAELVAEAKQIVERWQAEGFFGRRARLLSDAQGGKR